MPIMLYLCSVKLNIKAMQVTSKTEFNKMFKLTINGKYKGIDALGSDHNVALMFHKLNRKLRLFSSRPWYSQLDIMTMRIDGMTVKIYGW